MRFSSKKKINSNHEGMDTLAGLIKKRHFYKVLFVVCVLMLICLMFLFSTMGVASISFSESVKIMLNRIPLMGKFFSIEGLEDNYPSIVLNLRMPRIILSVLVGMGLSVVGAAFQGIFRNPMASPSVLGISSGAALGASIAITAGLGATVMGIGGITVSAFIGAVVTIVLVYNISRVGGKIPVTTLLLAGIAVGFLTSSVTHLIMIFNRSAVEGIVMWMMGSVSGASWDQIYVVFPIIIIGTVFIAVFSRDLNVMSTGDETASSLGIEVERVKKILLAVSSILVATCVSVSGIISFVGLIVPHIVRLILGSNHKILLPFSAVGGAVFMLLCDTIARNLVYAVIKQPVEIPVGVITSSFGAPFFIYLLIKRKRKVV